jgi:type IV pilus assembly protein PilE
MGILATIAVPPYRHVVLRAHRFEAREALLSLAAAQERIYLEHRTYAGDSEREAAPPDGLGLPAITVSGWYELAIDTTAGPAGFTATATARGSQFDDAECAVLSIDAYGQRRASSREGAPATACWN